MEEESFGCPSTHGGAGFPVGTVFNGDGTFTCGLCRRTYALQDYWLTRAAPAHVSDYRPPKVAESRRGGLFARTRRAMSNFYSKKVRQGDQS